MLITRFSPSGRSTLPYRREYYHGTQSGSSLQRYPPPPPPPPNRLRTFSPEGSLSPTRNGERRIDYSAQEPMYSKPNKPHAHSFTQPDLTSQGSNHSSQAVNVNVWQKKNASSNESLIV